MIKWFLLAILALLVLFGLVSAGLYLFIKPKQDRNWAPEHAQLASISFQCCSENPNIIINNLRDFHWQAKEKSHYKNIKFKLNDIVELKAVVSHFSAISEIAHVFMIFVLEDGREFGVSVEARREQGEHFSISGGLLANFELIYVLASPEDLLGIRKINNEETHVYPIKENKEKSRELFMLIANEINQLSQKPRLYHLFFRNCTNQLVKHVSILTEQKYPWFFQTLAPGNTGKLLYDLDLIDIPDSTFEQIQAKTLVK